MKNFLFIAFTSAFLVGCATTEGYVKLVESWVGTSEIDLIRHWGAPDQTYKSGDSEFLVFNSYRSVYLPGTSPTYTTKIIGNEVHTTTSDGTPARNLNYSCETTFEISNELVVGYNFKGNDCRADPNKI